jgi:hypothetical protein
MDETLLDSDILSEILKAKNRQVLDTANRYLAQHSRFAFSAMTFYEITRGFRLTGTVRGLAKFLKLVDDSDVLPIVGLRHAGATDEVSTYYLASIADARRAVIAAMSDMVKPAHVVASLRDAKFESRRDSSTCLGSRIERATSEPHHPQSLAPPARGRG